MRQELSAGQVVLYGGDCLDVLDTLAENSVDAIISDPPYELAFMGRHWDQSGVAFCSKTWAKVLRVLKPGGHLLAFSGTRTSHRMVCAIEDAGFEIRDSVLWIYGSGFPKSLDVSKAIDKAAGAEREKIAIGSPVKRLIPGADQNESGSWIKDNGREYQPGVEIAATDAARAWDGWGTALKPAHEPICLARKPLSEPTVAANVLKWGTGALNVDACRVETDSPRPARTNERSKSGLSGTGGAVTYGSYAVRGSVAIEDTTLGRWPANLCHNGSDEVLTGFPVTKSGSTLTHHKFKESENIAMSGKNYARSPKQNHVGDTGSAARFFYCAKASKADRADSKHPTVKPVALMRWLCRLITPPGGVVLDPFAGTGTTGRAAVEEGFRAIMIEREKEYRADIIRRFAPSVAKVANFFD